jgi:glycosyltransferase involved in cell wall biosynthesis
MQDRDNVRIVYVHQYFLTPQMPGGTRSYEWARRLARRGHDVHVVTSDILAPKGSRRWRTGELEGFTVHWLPVPYSNEQSYARRLWAFVRFMLWSSIRATQLRPEVVLATSTPLTVAVPGIIASRLHRVRFVFEVRDLWPELPIQVGALRDPVSRTLARALARLAYRNAARVVALSPGMAAGVRSYGIPAERITVVPNASDLELFSVGPDAAAKLRTAHAWLGERPLVVYAGSFGIANEVEWLVRLAEAVRRLDGDIRFLLLGDGRQVPAVRELAGELGLLDRTVFVHDPVPKAEMPGVLAAADVAASVFAPLPGMADNSANKFFDALAAGRPVLLNYGGWQADLVREHDAGLVLDRDDLEGSARALVALLRNRDGLAAAGKAARGLAEQQFSRDTLFETFEAAVTGRPDGGGDHGAA